MVILSIQRLVKILRGHWGYGLQIEHMIFTKALDFTLIIKKTIFLRTAYYPPISYSLHMKQSMLASEDWKTDLTVMKVKLPSE